MAIRPRLRRSALIASTVSASLAISLLGVTSSADAAPRPSARLLEVQARVINLQNQAASALNFITGSSNQVFYGLNMTASLIVSLPTLIVYIFLGRYFLRGLLSGSLKG